MNTIEQIKEWLVGYCGGNASSDFTFKEVAHAISVFMKEEYAGASAMNGSAGVQALNDIAEIVLKYHALNGDNPAANHCRNIALEALSKIESVSSPSPQIKEVSVIFQKCPKCEGEGTLGTVPTTCYVCNGEKVVRVNSPSPLEAETAEYWKKRCEAAENLIAIMDVPKNNPRHSENEQFIKFGDRNEAWQKSKHK